MITMFDNDTSCKRKIFSCVPEVMDACHSFKKGESDQEDGYRGGKLALAMECTQNVALNKLNPNNEHNVPTLKDAIKLTDYFDDDRILKSWANSRGFLLVEKIVPEEVDEEEILDAMLNLSRDFGHLGEVYHTARADGIIDPEEHKMIVKAATMLRTSVAMLENIIETQVREIPVKKGVLING